MEKERSQELGITLAVGASLGVLAGVLATKWLIKRQKMKPEVVLEQVKSAFLAEGPIEGAWIEFTKTPLQKFAIKTQTYTGGITRLEDGDYAQYEFVADAQTGTVMDIYRLA